MHVEPSLSRLALAARWAWLPIPVFLLAVLIAWAVESGNAYPAGTLTFVFQLFCVTLASAVVAWFLARSFLASGAPGLLLLACGSVLWGLAGAAAGAFSGGDINRSITIHNLCVSVSAACHLLGALLSTHPRMLLARGWWLLAAFTAVLATFALVIFATQSSWPPVFFLQGEGGTWVRQALLGCSISMFVVSGLIVDGGGRPSVAFSRWYRLGLLLVAVG